MNHSKTKIQKVALLVSLIVSLTGAAGCAGFDTRRGQIIKLDAMDRVVSVNHRENIRKICAEQSPDAFALLAAAFAASGQSKGVAAQIAASMSESGGSLAFRTQVTQAQANLLYSLCQLEANDVLSKRAVRTEIRRFQHSLLAMLAIEQLTAPARTSPSTTIHSTSTASAGKDVEVAQKQLEQEQEALKTAKDTQATKEKELAALPNGTEAEKAARAKQDEEVAAAKEAVTKQEKQVKIAEEKLSAARLALSVSTGGQQAQINVTIPTSSSTISDTVAKSVIQALESTLNRGVLMDNCVEAVFEERIQPDVCRSAFETYLGVYKAREDAKTSLIASEAQKNLALASALKKCVDNPKADCSKLAPIFSPPPAQDTSGKSGVVGPLREGGGFNSKVTPFDLETLPPIQ